MRLFTIVQLSLSHIGLVGRPNFETLPVSFTSLSGMRHFPLLPTIAFGHAVKVRHAGANSPNIDRSWISMSAAMTLLAKWTKKISDSR